MISLKLYLDARHLKNEERNAAIKVVISRKRTTALLSSNVSVLPSQWDKKTQKVVNHPNEKRLNLHLSKFLVSIQNIVIEMEEQGLSAGMNATEVKAFIKTKLSGGEDERHTLYEYFIKLIDNKSNPRTKELYFTTLKRIKDFDKKCESLLFEDIDKTWLNKFDAFLSKTSPSKNARNIHLRNIRAVFNFAIDEGVINYYPFRKIKLKNVETPKRSLNVKLLRAFMLYTPKRFYIEQLDIFKLIFFLCGISFVDLFNLKSANLIAGRIEYHRAKTGKRYSIKVEPEALDIINKYRGSEYLLNLHSRYKNYKGYMQFLNKRLKMIAKDLNDNELDGISSYWARHSWATTAAELDIPKETIAAGLGHSIGNPITSIYIDFNLKKVDEANRKIIDYVLYNKV